MGHVYCRLCRNVTQLLVSYRGKVLVCFVLQCCHFCAAKVLNPKQICLLNTLIGTRGRYCDYDAIDSLRQSECHPLSDC